MPDRIVSVDENFDFPDSVTHRNAERLSDPLTPEGKVLSDKIPRIAGERYTPSEQIATMLDFSSGARTWAVASDSTANDLNDWVGTFLYLLKPSLSDNIGIEHRTWSTASNAWPTQATSVKSGTTPPQTGGVVMRDTFARTGSIVGSASDIGKKWVGSGGWIGNGSAAVPNNNSSVISYDTGSKDVTVDLEMDVTTLATSGTPYIRVYIGSGLAELADKGIWVQISINASGYANLSLWKRFAGVNTQFGTSDFDMGLVGNVSTPQRLILKVATSIQNVTVTASVGSKSKTYNATITEDEYSSAGTFVGLIGSNASTFASVDSINISTPLVVPAYSGLQVWNAAVGGATLAYQQERLAGMFNQPHIDVLIISGGHNYATKTPEQFIAEVKSFVSAYKALHPESMILVSSQNPQKAPAAYAEAHANRQAALREWAKREGYEYIPAFELFRSQPDDGDSLISSDGIHPTTPPAYSTEPSGATLWASAFYQMVNSRRAVIK